MDIVRDKLTEMGFVLEIKGNEAWADHVYHWEYYEERHGKTRVEIDSNANWHFKIKRALHGAETGVEGYDYIAFNGYISPKKALKDLETLLRCTGVENDINRHSNEYKTKLLF